MSYSQQWIDSQNSSQMSKVSVSSISVWDPSTYERLYLGWCLVNLQNSVLAEAICFVDDSWFGDNNRKIIYRTISDLVV